MGLEPTYNGFAIRCLTTWLPRHPTEPPRGAKRVPDRTEAVSYPSRAARSTRRRLARRPGQRREAAKRLALDPLPGEIRTTRRGARPHRNLPTMSASHDDDDDEPPTRAVSHPAVQPPATVPRATVPRATVPRATVPRATVPQVPAPRESDEDLATVVGVAFAKVGRRAPQRPPESVEDLAQTQAREEAIRAPDVARDAGDRDDAEPPSSIPRLDSDPDAEDDARATAVMRSPSHGPDLGEMLRRARTAGAKLPAGMITPTALERPAAPTASFEDAPTLDGPLPSDLRDSRTLTHDEHPRSYGADAPTLDGPSPLRFPRVYSEDAPTRERHADKPVVDDLPTLASPGGSAPSQRAAPAWANAPVPHETLRSADEAATRAPTGPHAESARPRAVPPAPQSASALYLATIPEDEAERVRPAAFGAMVMGGTQTPHVAPAAPAWGAPVAPAPPGTFPQGAPPFAPAPPFAVGDASFPHAPHAALHGHGLAAGPHGAPGGPMGPPPAHGAHAQAAYPPAPYPTYGYGAPAPAPSSKRLIVVAAVVVALVVPLVVFVLTRLFGDE